MCSVGHVKLFPNSTQPHTQVQIQHNFCAIPLSDVSPLSGLTVRLAWLPSFAEFWFDRPPASNLFSFIHVEPRGQLIRESKIILKRGQGIHVRSHAHSTQRAQRMFPASITCNQDRACFVYLLCVWSDLKHRWSTMWASLHACTVNFFYVQEVQVPSMRNLRRMGVAREPVTCTCHLHLACDKLISSKLAP